MEKSQPVKRRAGAPLGNHNAARGKVWRDTLRRIALRNGSVEDIAKALIKMAKKGNVNAIREFGDRFEGKVPQAIEGVDGKDLLPVQDSYDTARRIAFLLASAASAPVAAIKPDTDTDTD